jgi:hypothetical protein
MEAMLEDLGVEFGIASRVESWEFIVADVAEEAAALAVTVEPESHVCFTPLAKSEAENMVTGPPAATINPPTHSNVFLIPSILLSIDRKER